MRGGDSAHSDRFGSGLRSAVTNDSTEVERTNLHLSLSTSPYKATHATSRVNRQSRKYLVSSGTDDPSQRFFQQVPIRSALCVGALGQVV